MRALSILFSVSMLCASTQAQYTIDWAQGSGDYNRSGVMAARDTADNLIITGYRPSYVGAAHIYTRKYNKFGVLQWERIDSTGIHSRYERPTWVNTNAQNEIYVTGFAYVGTSNTYPDSIVVVKYSPAGVLLWRRMIPRGTNLSFRQIRTELDASGYLYLGTIGSSPAGFSLIKLDAAGNTVFDVQNASTAGGIFNSMRVRNGRVVMVASGQNNTLAHAVSFTTAGAFLWSLTTAGFGGIDVELDDAGNSYLLTTYPNQVSATSQQDIVIKKINTSGVVTNQYNYDFGGYEAATHLTLVNGRITVIGTTVLGAYTDWVTFQTNTSGVQYWNVQYNQTPYNDEHPGWVVAKASGEVFVTGQGGPPPGGQLSYLSYVTLKYSSTGVQQWAHTDPYFGYNGVACVLAKDSSLYVLGRADMTAVHYLDNAGNTVKVGVKVFLEGPFDGVSLMSDALRAANLLPASEPYSGLGFTMAGGAGESVAPSVLTVTGANAIVDWVLVELRNAGTPAQIVATRCGLLQRDGDVVGLDGVNPLSITAAPGNYYVAVRHRNHLGCMTATALALSNTATTIDLRAAATSTWGTLARKTMNTNMVLWSGNALHEAGAGTLKYTGANNDRDPILVAVGGSTPNNVVLNTYSTNDVNMNGNVSYTGSGNDRDPILVNVGSTAPNNVRVEQLP